MEIREVVLVPLVPNNSYGLCRRNAALNTITCVPTYPSSCTDRGRMLVVWENRRAFALLAFQRYLDSQRACLRKRVCTYADPDWLKLTFQSEGGESRVNCPGFELCEMCQTQVAIHTPGIRLHALVYDILLPNTAINGYATGFRKLSAN